MKGRLRLREVSVDKSQNFMAIAYCLLDNSSLSCFGAGGDGALVRVLA